MTHAPVYDRAESVRLAAEAAEDDARMPAAPWDCVPLTVRLHVDDRPLGSVSFGIARTRNNLRAIAAQLDAATVKIDRLTEERDGYIEQWEGRNAQYQEERRINVELGTERDALHVQVADLQRTIDTGNVAFQQAREQWQSELSRRPLRSFDQISADRMADEIDVLVRRKVIDSRSPAADALLDYRDPPQSKRSDRLVDLVRAIEDIIRHAQRTQTSSVSGVVAALQRALGVPSLATRLAERELAERELAVASPAWTPVVGDRVLRPVKHGAAVGEIVEIIESSLLPYVVRWPDGGVVAYCKAEIEPAAVVPGG